MELKANLHFHTRDDPRDAICYTLQEGVERAKNLGFEVLALTCHQKFVNVPEYYDYAASRNILLIPGVERNIEKRHVVILNPDKDVEGVSTFRELKDYKKSRPEIFVLAPHPYFYGGFSLKEKLTEHIELFDAVEHSWFYSRAFNRNKKGEAAAEEHSLPFIATSDTHALELLDVSYSVIEAKEKTIPAIFEAIKNKNFTNVTSPRKFLKEMVWEEGCRQIKSYCNRIAKRCDISS